MRILITGATGFIGTRLTNLLSDLGHEVVGLTRCLNVPSKNSGAKYYVHDIGTPFSTEIINFSPELLIHLAWEGIPDFSREMSSINLTANIRFLKEIEKFTALKKIIVSGSCWEYSHDSGVCREIDTSVPNTYFSWAKYSIYLLFNIFCNDRRVSLDWFRIFYVYGPGQRSSSLIPTILSSIRSGQQPDIRNMFSANDYIYLDDVVSAIAKAAVMNESLGIVNLGSGTLTQTKRILEICQSLLEPYEVSDIGVVGIYADISKAKTLLNWSPRYDLNQGIRETNKVF